MGHFNPSYLKYPEGMCAFVFLIIGCPNVQSHFVRKFSPETNPAGNCCWVVETQHVPIMFLEKHVDDSTVLSIHNKNTQHRFKGERGWIFGWPSQYCKFIETKDNHGK